ncbi:MAG: cytochrome C [Chloroflexi bacterium]|nr:cytochrome C [Chloroflexota bacterium]
MVQRSHSLARRQAFLALLALALLVVMAACTQTGQATPTAAPSKAPAATTAPSGTTAPGGAATGVAAGNAEQGKAAIAKYNCGSCYTIPGISGANGTVGPSLANYPNIPQIAATLPNTPDNTVKWIMDPPAVKPGTAMPKLGVTQQDAQNIAAYLYTLK